MLFIKNEFKIIFFGANLGSHIMYVKHLFLFKLFWSQEN